MFIRKRPEHLGTEIAAIVEAFAGLTEAELAARLGALPVTAPRPVAGPAIAKQLRQHLAPYFPLARIDVQPPGAAAPRCFLKVRLPDWPDALNAYVLSEDLADYKVMLAWRGGFENSYAPREIGRWGLTVAKVRVHDLFLEREVDLGPALDYGFVTAPRPVDMLGLAHRVAACLGQGHALALALGEEAGAVVSASGRGMMRPDDVVITCITCGDLDEARRIGRALVEQSVAACVNLHTHETISRWEGGIAQAPEAAVLARTAPDVHPALLRLALGEHPPADGNASGEEPMPPSDIIIVYVTCADLDEARRIGRVLVEEGLAACVNLRAHETIYRWQGAIEQGPEAALLAKTTRDTYPALQARVRSLHLYTLPCIIAWAIDEGLPGYLDWIGAAVTAC